MRTSIGVLSFVALAATFTLTLLGATPGNARACTCLPPTVESSYNNSSDVVAAGIVREWRSSATTYYLAQVRRTFKGCLKPRQYVFLQTPSSSAACGLQLNVGDTYLINGDRVPSASFIPRLAVTLCDYNQLYSALSKHDLEFLDGRMVCCGDKCTCADGTDPVQCFVDPCEVAPPCPEGKCVANYCGGCNAEFYDESGYAVCQGCESNADCAPSEYCGSDGACHDDGSCEIDVDCNLDGNDYVHIECVGHGVCERMSCGWECGDPRCIDFAGYDFGACEALLGWGPVDGACTLISGCGSGGFELFATEAECARACVPS